MVFVIAMFLAHPDLTGDLMKKDVHKNVTSQE